MQATSLPVMAGEPFSQPFPQEFDDLFQEHYVLVYRTAYAVTGRVEDAEDVVQTIFLRLLKLPLAATIFTALEEQLGLKLERAQAPREFIVIDHVERPSPN